MGTSTRRPALVIAVTAGLVVVAVMAFLIRDGGDEPAPTSERATASALQFLPSDATGAYDGLCTALAQASAGAPGDARFTYYAEAHEGLHGLSTALQTVDEAAAARYERVKTGFETAIGDPIRGDPVPSLRVLIEATADGIESFGAARPAPCP